MENADHSGGGCCGSAAKAESNEQHQPLEKPNGGKGCGCGDSKVAIAEISLPEPVTAEKAAGGCCGGK